MTHHDIPPAHESFLTELEGLAGLASQKSGLSLEVSDDLESPWSFNWATKRITANPADLALRPPDFCRGLVLHEAGHAALTRLFDVVPPALHRNGAVHHLLNVLEDCRLEGWLQARLPGCAPWIRMYNNLLFAPMLESSREDLESDQASAFLCGVLARWWFQKDPPNLPDLARAALDEAWPHLKKIFVLYPPAVCPAAAEAHARYDNHPVRACYLGCEEMEEVTPLEMETRLCQHEMWEITRLHVLPLFQRLMERTNSPMGVIARHLEALNALVRVVRALPRPPGQGRPERSAGRMLPGGDFFSGPLEPASGADYHRTRGQYQGEIEQIAESLLHYLTAEVRLRYRRFHRSGQRLDLRQAMQFEADPRLHDSLWMRINLPTRPDPAFVILADASSSMLGERAHTTFDALVILREVCLRLNIPLSIVLFNQRAQIIQTWDRPEAGHVLPLLCALRNHPQGGTCMEAGLAAALQQLAAMPNRHRHFWLLSDGETADEMAAKRQLRLLESKAASIHALGLGPDTESLVKLVPGAFTNLEARHLPVLTKHLFQHLARAA